MLRDLLSDLRYRLRALFRREDLERDLAEELQFHLDREAEKLGVHGAEPDEARRQARLAFGGVEEMKEASRDARGVRRVEQFAQAVKRAWRTLRRSPGFVVVSVLSLGVALGLATATFALIDSSLHPKALFRRPDRWDVAKLRFGNRTSGPSIAEQMRGLATLPAVQTVGVESYAQELTTIGGAAAVWTVAHESANLFPALGVPLKLGRYPTPQEIAADRAALVSSAVWTESFADRSAIDGATLSVGGHVYSIVGVVPPGHAGPLSAPVVIPYASPGAVERLRQGDIVVELRANVDTEAAHAQVATLAARYQAQYVSPLTITTPYGILLIPLAPAAMDLRQDVQGILMLALALGMLLIGCTNVTALALARGLTRRREYALRIALGATRAGIAADVLAEVLVIGVGGAVLGLLIANAVIGVLTHLVPEDLATWGDYVFGFSPWVFTGVGLALLGGMGVAGGVPAWRASRVDPADPLKDNAGTTTGRSRNEFRLLVITELAVAMVLLMLTSLMALSTRNLADYRYAFAAHSLVHVYITPADGAADTSDVARRALLARAVQAVREVPDVVAVTTMGYGIPDAGEVLTDRRPTVPSLRVRYYETVGARFFETMGIRLAAGRDLSDADILGEGAVVLSRTAANALFPHENAIGHMIKLGWARGSRPWLRVVGIAPDVAMNATDSFDPSDNPMIYVASAQTVGMTNIVARMAPHAGAMLLPAIERALSGVLPQTTVVSALPWTLAQNQEIRANRIFEQFLSVLTFAALILGVTGLFSVLSYSVGQRMREFAVRQALGATRRNIVRVVLTSAFEMALGGTAIGALLSFWASAGISWRLFGVKNTDPGSLLIAEATLMAVAMAAALVPALRAMRSDPVEILRSS